MVLRKMPSLSGTTGIDYSGYANDPVGFCQKFFKETYTDDIRRMMESVRDNEVTVAISANGPGKTHGAARVSAWFYKVFPDSQVYTAAAPPEGNLKKLLWGQMGDLARKMPRMFAGDTITSLHIERGPLSFLTGVTIPSSGDAATREAKFSGKHAPFILFVVDEGDAVPDEVYKGIESCMSGGHARLLVMFNPRAERGYAYRMIRDGRANVIHLSALNHPNVVTGKNIFPGAVTREATVRRFNLWTQPLGPNDTPDDNCVEVPACLVGCVAVDEKGSLYPPLAAGWRRITVASFSYMVLGRYPAMGDMQLISREWIAAARARWDTHVAEFGQVAPPGVVPTAGYDPADEGADDNALIIRYGGWVPVPEVWKGVDVNKSTIRVGRRLVGVVREVNVDGTGVGAAGAPHLRREFNIAAQKIMVASKPTEKTEIGEFGLLRDQLAWSCREWLRTDSGAMLPPDDELVEELAVITYANVNGKIRTMRKVDIKEAIGRSPNKADALFLTFAPRTMVFQADKLEKCFA